MFVVILTYLKPIEDVEDAVIPHRAFLDELYAKKILLMSGPQTPRTGGILIATGGRSKTELIQILKADPFYTMGIASYEIIEFNPIKHVEELKEFCN